MKRIRPLSRRGIEEHYNYAHFGAKTLYRDMRLAMVPTGPFPGEQAPNFSLTDTEGRVWVLNELRDKPMVLIFGSGTCPVTTGSLPGLKELYLEFGEKVHWFMIYVREAHPGENMPAHRSYEQKLEQAQRTRDEEGIAWPILIGELDGRTHQHFSQLPNHVYLLDHQGIIAFRGELVYTPPLRGALLQLEAQGRKGPVKGKGVDKTIPVLGPIAFGWRGPRRGGRAAILDIIYHTPPLAAILWLGNLVHPLIAPIAARSKPLPRGAKVAKVAVAVVIVGLAAFMLRRTHRHD